MFKRIYKAVKLLFPFIISNIIVTVVSLTKSTQNFLFLSKQELKKKVIWKNGLDQTSLRLMLFDFILKSQN